MTPRPRQTDLVDGEPQVTRQPQVRAGLWCLPRDHAHLRALVRAHTPSMGRSARISKFTPSDTSNTKLAPQDGAFARTRSAPSSTCCGSGGTGGLRTSTDSHRPDGATRRACGPSAVQRRESISDASAICFIATIDDLREAVAKRVRRAPRARELRSSPKNGAAVSVVAVWARRRRSSAPSPQLRHSGAVRWSPAWRSRRARSHSHHRRGSSS
jgi:hypothetical protein